MRTGDVIARLKVFWPRSFVIINNCRIYMGSSLAQKISTWFNRRSRRMVMSTRSHFLCEQITRRPWVCSGDTSEAVPWQQWSTVAENCVWTTCEYQYGHISSERRGADLLQPSLHTKCRVTHRESRSRQRMSENNARRKLFWRFVIMLVQRCWQHRLANRCHTWRTES